MSRIVVCDSCDERIPAGMSCVELRAYEDEAIPFPVSQHFHDLCWERNQDVLVSPSRLRASGIGRQATLGVVLA